MTANRAEEPGTDEAVTLHDGDMNSPRTVRVFMHSDSGPYGWWSCVAADFPRSYVTDGFGVKQPVREVPAELWERYERAREAEWEAKAAIDKYFEAFDA